MDIEKIKNESYCYENGTLDKILQNLKSAGFRVCSLEDIARLRILEDEILPISKNNKSYPQSNTSSHFDEGQYIVSEGILCFPGIFPKAKLIKDSPWLKDNYKEFWKDGNFYPPEEQIEQLLKNSIDFPAINGASSGIVFETDKFDKEELTVFIFGGGDKDLAKEYGNLLNKSGVDKICVYPTFKEFINEHKAPYIEQVYYGRDWDDFEIRMGGETVIYPHNNLMVYGIRNNFRKTEMDEIIISLKINE